MPSQAKREAVAELVELLKGSTALAVADYRGLRVTEIQSVRRSLGSGGITFRVVKNSLMSIAADEAGLGELKTLLVGPTAVATGSGDEVAIARRVLEALRPYTRVVHLRGALLGNQPIDAEALQRLSTLPAREVLLARLAGGMQAPVSRMASVLAGNLRNLAGVLAAVAEKKQQSEGGGQAAAGS